jgi:hypothetical protein
VSSSSCFFLSTGALVVLVARHLFGSLGLVSLDLCRRSLPARAPVGREASGVSFVSFLRSVNSAQVMCAVLAALRLSIKG